TTAALMAWEGATLGAHGGDARRLLLSRLVIEHRLAPQDPLSLAELDWEQEAMDLLLQDEPVPLAKATALLSS
ncbi:MAG TPA: DNA alkylation response protein, partial [Reyranella sp.]